MNLRTLLLMLAGAAALAACGDSPQPDLGTPPGNMVPASATASPAAWTAYTASLPPSDTQDPVDVNGATPPTSETDEARPI